MNHHFLSLFSERYPDWDTVDQATALQRLKRFNQDWENFQQEGWQKA